MKKLVLCLITSAGLLSITAHAADPDKAADDYKKSGKKASKGTKEAGTDLKHGEVTAGAKDFGKGVGHGAAKIGESTLVEAAGSTGSVHALMPIPVVSCAFLRITQNGVRLGGVL